MKKLFTTASLAALIGLGATASFARDLAVVSWGGAYQEAQREAYFDVYAENFGGIKDEAYNGELAKIKAMVETGDVTWDVVQMEAPELENACEEGLIERIDWDRLGGKDQMIPTAVMGDCGIGTIVWSTVLAYDTQRVGAKAPASWADFWDTSTWPGKRALRKSAKFTLEIALLADGVAPEKIYEVLATEEGQDRAFAKLDELKDHIQWWESGAQPPQWLAAGDVVMTSAYNGRISSAADEGQTFKIVWNGQVYTLDGWVIVEGTPNQDAAYDFLSVTTDPMRQATLSATIPYGPTHTMAVDAVPGELQSRLPTAPANLEAGLYQDTNFWIDHIEELTERFNNWASQ